MNGLARRAIPSLLAWLLFAPATAHGHEPDEDGGERKERPQAGEEIEVVGHHENRVGTTDAASAGAATHQLVEDRPILRPGEVLELVPGLVVTQHSGAGKANQYFLRGFNLDHGTDFLTTLDGMPVNLRTHAHGQGYTDLNFLIPELVQRIDYVKGPYYASKGDFASAGAADLRYAEDVPRTAVGGTGGGYGYGRVVALGSPHLAGGHLLYGFEVLHEDGPWRRPDDYGRWNGVLRYTHPLWDGSIGATAMAYVGSWNATDQIPRRAVEAGLVDRFGFVDPTDGGSSHRYSLSANVRQDLGGGILQASAYGVRYDLDLFSDFTYFLVDPVRGDQFEQRDGRWLVGTSGSWTVGVSAGGLDSELAVGWEVRQDRIDPVALHHTEARRRLETIRRDRVRETSGGLYARLDTSVTPWLHAVLGARWDEYAFDVTNEYSLVAGGALPANSGDVSAGRPSPKASLVLGPFARTELFADAGAGFHSNDARGVTTHVDPRSGVAIDPVTPLVRTVGSEVGVRTEIVPHVQSSLALWRLDLASELVFQGDAGSTEPSRPSRRQGIEWSTRWQPARWLLFDLDAAWSRARFTAPDPKDPSLGPYIPGAIESAVSAGATIREVGRLSASLFLRFFGPRPLTEDDRPRSSPSTLLDGQLVYRATRAVRLTFDAFNLFDARADDIAYFYTSRLAWEPAGTPGIHFHPAEPRSFRAGATFSF